MINVLGYVRVSTENQAKEGYSLEQQKWEIENYCEENNFNLIKTYEDSGVSGANADEEELSIDRDGLQDVISFIKNNDIKYVIVLNTSRLWRSDMVKMLIHRAFKKYNVDIKAIDKPSYSIYDKSPNNYLLNTITDAIDVYERMEIAVKLSRGRKEKAKQGGYAGGQAPYGYTAIKGRKVLTINETEAQVVKRIFELRNTCPWLTLKKIAETLINEGCKGRNGSIFNIMLVKRILDKQYFYKGYYKYADVVSKGKHEPIILS